jgi:uncharacterized protein
MLSSSFSTVIIKLTALCNLDCRYCYMFNLADETYRRVPHFCSTEIAILAVERLVEEARKTGRSKVSVVLHGGEPLLWPYDRFEALFAAIERKRSDGTIVNVSLQSNGLEIPTRTARLLKRHDVSLGISLDGPAEINDRQRVRHDGLGSYHRVMDSVSRTLDDGFPPERLGFLSVVDPAIKPVDYFDWASELPSRNISPLWPIQFSWASPPWPEGSEKVYLRHPRYGVWMAAAFEEWWRHRVEDIQVRLFLDTISRLLGLHWHSDSIGNDFVDMFVVNTDGGIEYPDYLRAHEDGGSRTSYSVITHSLAEVRRNDPLFGDLLRLRTRLPAECLECCNEDVCGGGFLAGRVGRDGFDPRMRSVLCYDQMFYFNAVRDQVFPYVEAMRAVDTQMEARCV